MDLLARRVARRFLVAELLSKSWLMGVRRGWIKVVESIKAGSQEREDAVFKGLHLFLDNMEEQIRFIHKPWQALMKIGPRAQKYQKAMEAMRYAIGYLENDSHLKRKDVEFYQNRYKHEERKVRSKYGLGEHESLLTDQEAEHVVTTEQENAAVFRKFPELEETRLQRDHAFDLWSRWVDNGGLREAAIKRLIPPFDKLLKVLYEDAREIKDLTEQHGQDLTETPDYTNFDLNGVKVIIDDRTVPPIQVRQYIKYFDETHARLEAKGFGKVWRGTIFVQCEECGGENPHGKDFGVGGDYHIGKDDIRIYSRPSEGLVRLLSHELAHRYWYKHMGQAQRAKFEALIRVNKNPRVKADLEKIEAARQVVYTTISEREALLHDFEIAFRSAWDSTDIQAAVARFAPQLEKAVLGKDPIYNALDGALSRQHLAHGSPERTELYKVFDRYTGTEQAAEVKFRRHLLKRTVEAAGVAGHDGLTAWLREAERLLNAMGAAAHAYLDYVKTAHTKHLDEDESKVLPVSEYGTSNPSEAFAEVVSYFVTGRSMTRDQLESMRAVLSSVLAPDSPLMPGLGRVEE